MEKSGQGIRLLMLGTGELWGDERSMMTLFFPEYFLVAMPIGLILNGLNGGLGNVLIMNLSLIFWSKSLSTMSGWEVADCRLWHV